MLASFFVKNGTVKILGGVYEDGILGDFMETLRPGENFLGLPCEEFMKRGSGSIDFDPSKKAARFVDAPEQVNKR